MPASRGLVAGPSHILQLAEIVGARFAMLSKAIRPPYFSGCIWAIGFSFMIVGISVLGFSVGYTLDAVGPIVVASMLSIFVPLDALCSERIRKAVLRFKEITRPKQLALRLDPCLVVDFLGFLW